MTLRVKRSNSMAASVRMEIFSLAVTRASPAPLVARGDTPVPPAKLGAAAGEPDFLCSNELKKFARTPSPLGVPGLSLPST